MNTYRNPRLTILAAALVMAVTPAVVSAQEKDPIRIALISSKSGTISEQGEAVLSGARFAIEEANAKGGIDGRKIQVQEADDESSTDVARRNAEKLARDGYNMIIGPLTSPMVLAIAPNLERWNALLFSVAAKSDKITAENCRPRMFRINQSDSMDMALIRDWAKSFKEKSYGTLAADYVWGHDSTQTFSKTITDQGKEVKVKLFPPIGTKDFAPYIAQLKSANIEAVWVAEIGRDGVAFIKQARELGLTPKVKFIGHAMIQSWIVEATGQLLDGALGTINYGADLNNPSNSAFVAAFRAKHKRLPTDNEGIAYAGMQTIFEGVRMAKSTKAEDVAKALSGKTLDTVFGPTLMRAADNQLMVPNLVGSVKMVDGALRPVVERQFAGSAMPPASPLCKMASTN